jgi:nitrate/TMAO reductase-like tetraheme cytochrome c subunit
VTWAGRAFIAGLIGLALFTGLTYTAVHYTAQPPFCNSCHIMEPYYESWKHSSHSQVACIECHYEPGAVETFEGKFKALSQLAKYVTRTAGTKPWAEVSDASCMRSGCHSVRMLEGPVTFGRIKFDHRQHLLESRRGRRLRCVSCHSQIVQGEHVAVTSSVCFMCHFMPGEGGEIPEKTGDCMTCHGPPAEELEVAGKPFRHDEFVGRGVDCRECHDPVVEGDGTVRKERCHSCHAEVGHVERIGETAFLHEKHVTEHKVECFECHDDIRHGLLPVAEIAPAPSEGCGACHVSSHDAARNLYQGTGAVGVEPAPSRMHETRVVCEACHTGRSGFRVADAGFGGPRAAHALDAEARGHAPFEGAASVAVAGNVDCIHCHGPSYDGMLAEWQATVGEQIDRLRPMLEELRAEVGRDPAHPASSALREAERNVALVALDGSRGAHNVDYALDALRAAAARIDAVRGLIGAAEGPGASAGFPARSKDGCSTCHSAVGLPAEISRAERVFPHVRHVRAGLDCDACHSATEHGKPAFPREQCASCHHQESETRDVSDCASCHSAQEAMLRGSHALLDAPKPGAMGEMECGECHGEAPAILRPKPQMCVLCHEAGYDDMHRQWQAEIAAAVTDVAKAIEEARARGAQSDALERAQAALDAVRRDGSVGVHNFELAKFLLQEASRALHPE